MDTTEADPVVFVQSKIRTTRRRRGDREIAQKFPGVSIMCGDRAARADDTMMSPARRSPTNLEILPAGDLRDGVWDGVSTRARGGAAERHARQPTEMFIPRTALPFLYMPGSLDVIWGRQELSRQRTSDCRAASTIPAAMMIVGVKWPMRWWAGSSRGQRTCVAAAPTDSAPSAAKPALHAT
jgi:hypothetical protein